MTELLNTNLSSTIATIIYIIILQSLFVTTLCKISVNDSAEMTDDLTLQHLLMHRHIYDTSYRKTIVHRLNGDFEGGDHVNIPYSSGDPGYNVVREMDHIQLTPEMTNRIYSKPEIETLMAKLAEYCQKLNRVTFSTLDHCIQNCEPPCSKKAIHCPWKYCRKHSNEVCAWRCQSNSVTRGLIVGIAIVLILIAIVCFCRACLNCRNGGYDRAQMDYDKLSEFK